MIASLAALTRHAELVSAPIVPRSQVARSEKWALIRQVTEGKQVQGDDLETSLQVSTG